MKPFPEKALVIGGGIAGPALALALRRMDFDVDVFEARGPSIEAGAFFNLAPNGVNALKTLGVAHRLAEAGFHSDAMRFYNGRGKQIGELDSRDELARYGAANVMIKRGELHRILREEAERHGVRFVFNKRLVGVESNGQVAASFDDGTTATGDLLFGCDGLHSRVRRLVLPEAPSPAFTGIIDCGGYAMLPPGTVTPCVQHMIFGKRAFFGYVARPDGEAWWFSNVPWPAEPERGALEAVSDEAWRDRLRVQHTHDPAPVREILGSGGPVAGKWPLYVMPPLPHWHRGRVCLLGDAAHAIPPHVGQGASLALEDVLVLAACLRDAGEPRAAFASFQQQRQARVARIVAQARRIGKQKAPGPIQAWFRDLLLPAFIKAGAKKAAQIYAYRVDEAAHAAAAS